ncbi:hypothetical protein [Flavobacterium sp.]|uniref:hypothetical protein n=1 Tax=Flavobacterium sp. TaxID=239 RepID=UPI003D14AFEC
MKKNLIKISLFGIGISLIVLSVKSSIGGKIAAALALFVFIFILLKGYGILTKKDN